MLSVAYLNPVFMTTSVQVYNSICSCYGSDNGGYLTVLTCELRNITGLPSLGGLSLEEL